MGRGSGWQVWQGLSGLAAKILVATVCGRSPRTQDAAQAWLNRRYDADPARFPLPVLQVVRERDDGLRRAGERRARRDRAQQSRSDAAQFAASWQVGVESPLSLECRSRRSPNQGRDAHQQFLGEVQHTLQHPREDDDERGADGAVATDAARRLGAMKDRRAVPELARAARSVTCRARSISVS